jgi:hypothetical protein
LFGFQAPLYVKELKSRERLVCVTPVSRARHLGRGSRVR